MDSGQGAETMKKIILIAGGVLLLGGATFGGVMAGKGLGKPKAAAEEHSDKDEVVADATGKGEAKPEAGEKHSEAAKGDVKAEGKSTENVKVSKKDLMFSFGKEFTVNLLDPKPNIFVQAQIVIEAVDLNGREELDDNIAPLRDATILLLTSKSIADIHQNPAGKDRLKRELLARYEGIVKPGTIANIYFTDLTVIRK
jgi:flagellar protein FliL